MTEIDAGHETPDATRLPGFFHAIFQGENKKMQMLLFAARAGIELENCIFGGQNSHIFVRVLPLFLDFKMLNVCVEKEENMHYEFAETKWISHTF